jgi:hypothetical protein
MNIHWIAVILLMGLSHSSSAAPLNPAIRARIAALTNEGEGKLVTEKLMRLGDNPGTETQRRLMLAAKAAMPYLDESVRQADWNETHMGLDGPVCFDAAPKLGLMFRARGLPGYVASCAHHVFMIVETPEAVLLIDPTIRQYFGQDGAPSWVPQIFVGTLSELKALYARDPNLPVLPYQAIYFNSESPAYRRDSKMLNRRDNFLWLPASKEHAPLTDFFNAEKF